MVAIQEGQALDFGHETKMNSTVHFWTTLDKSAYAVIIIVYYEKTNILDQVLRPTISDNVNGT